MSEGVKVGCSSSHEKDRCQHSATKGPASRDLSFGDNDGLLTTHVIAGIARHISSVSQNASNSINEPLQSACSNSCADNERLQSFSTDSSGSRLMSKGAGKMTVVQLKPVSVGELNPTDTNRAIEVKVYREWTGKNVPHPEPSYPIE